MSKIYCGLLWILISGRVHQLQIFPCHKSFQLIPKYTAELVPFTAIKTHIVTEFEICGAAVKQDWDYLRRFCRSFYDISRNKNVQIVLTNLENRNKVLFFMLH